MRNEYIKNNPRCIACLEDDPKKLQVHHLIPYSLYPEGEYDQENMATLCKICHLLLGHLKNWCSYNPTCLSDCRIMAEKIRKRP